MHGSWGKGPVEQQHLVWRVTDDVDGDACDEHLDDSLALPRVVLRSAGWLAELLRAGEQPPADDCVASYLQDDWYQVEQRRLGVLVRHEIQQVVSGETEAAEALVGVWRVDDEGVEERDWKGEEQHARPDDGDHRLNASPAAVDVRCHRVDDGNVPGNET